MLAATHTGHGSLLQGSQNIDVCTGGFQYWCKLSWWWYLHVFAHQLVVHVLGHVAFVQISTVHSGLCILIV